MSYLERLGFRGPLPSQNKQKISARFEQALQGPENARPQVAQASVSGAGAAVLATVALSEAHKKFQAKKVVQANAKFDTYFGALPKEISSKAQVLYTGKNGYKIAVFDLDARFYNKHPEYQKLFHQVAEGRARLVGGYDPDFLKDPYDPHYVKGEAIPQKVNYRIIVAGDGEVAAAGRLIRAKFSDAPPPGFKKLFSYLPDVNERKAAHDFAKSILGKYFRADDVWGEIGHTFVLPKYRGDSFASLLYDGLLGRAAKEKIPVMFGTSSLGNFVPSARETVHKEFNGFFFTSHVFKAWPKRWKIDYVLPRIYFNLNTKAGRNKYIQLSHQTHLGLISFQEMIRKEGGKYVFKDNLKAELKRAFGEFLETGKAHIFGRETQFNAYSLSGAFKNIDVSSFLKFARRFLRP